MLQFRNMKYKKKPVAVEARQWFCQNNWPRGEGCQGTPHTDEFGVEHTISVGAILSDTARVFPAAKEFPIGESLVQATLSPQEAADLLFYLMNVMSTVSARTTTPSTAPISYSTNVDLMTAFDSAQRMRLRRDIETTISKAKPRKSGGPKTTKPRSSKLKRN